MLKQIKREYKTGSEEITSFGDIRDSVDSVNIGETDVLNQELASSKDWITTLMLQKETILT